MHTLTWFDGLPFIFKLTSISFIGFRNIVFHLKHAKKCKKRMGFDKINLKVVLIVEAEEKMNFDWFEQMNRVDFKELASNLKSKLPIELVPYTGFRRFLWLWLHSLFASNSNATQNGRKPYKLNKLKTIHHLNRTLHLNRLKFSKSYRKWIKLTSITTQRPKDGLQNIKWI